MSNLLDDTTFNRITLAMSFVMKYLNIQERLDVSEVCTAWEAIALDPYVWKDVNFSDVRVTDCNQFMKAFKVIRTRSLNSSNTDLPRNKVEFKKFWEKFYLTIREANDLQDLTLHDCPILTVENIMGSLSQLRSLKVISFCYQMIQSVDTLLNLGNLNSLTNLTELKLKGGPTLKLTLDWGPRFANLIHLKTLSITSFDTLPMDILETVSTGIEKLELGICFDLCPEIFEPLRNFINLTSLRVEECRGNTWEFFVGPYLFPIIRSLEKLETLEFINVVISYCFLKEIRLCTRIKRLLIVPDYSYSETLYTTSRLVRYLLPLNATLTHLVWGIPVPYIDIIKSRYFHNEILKKISFLDCYLRPVGFARGNNNIFYSRRETRNLPNDNTYQNVYFMTVDDFRDHLRIQFPLTRIIVKMINAFKESEVYLATEFRI